MNDSIITILKDILFQLHAISAQNFGMMAETIGTDESAERLRNWGKRGLAQETIWMEDFLNGKGDETECPSGNSSSSDF